MCSFYFIVYTSLTFFFFTFLLNIFSCSQDVCLRGTTEPPDPQPLKGNDCLTRCATLILSWLSSRPPACRPAVDRQNKVLTVTDNILKELRRKASFMLFCTFAFEDLLELRINLFDVNFNVLYHSLIFSLCCLLYVSCIKFTFYVSLNVLQKVKKTNCPVLQ